MDNSKTKLFNLCNYCKNWTSIGLAANAGWCEKKDIGTLYSDSCNDGDFHSLRVLSEEQIDELVDATNFARYLNSAINCNNRIPTNEELKKLREEYDNLKDSF